MSLTQEQVAEAFSRHDFAAAYDHLAEDVRWSLVGAEQCEGREAVVEWCERSVDYLATVTTRFSKFRVVSGGDHVVVDSTAEYTAEGEQPSVVASCDIYRFAGGRVAEITSYNIELGGNP